MVIENICETVQEVLDFIVLKQKVVNAILNFLAVIWYKDFMRVKLKKI